MRSSDGTLNSCGAKGIVSSSWNEYNVDNVLSNKTVVFVRIFCTSPPMSKPRVKRLSNTPLTACMPFHRFAGRPTKFTLSLNGVMSFPRLWNEVDMTTDHFFIAHKKHTKSFIHCSSDMTRQSQQPDRNWRCHLPKSLTFARCP